jgi:hypothetical protein
MRIFKTISILIALLLLNTAAEAQQRVFVSASHGDDANTCTVNAPCRSFAKALTIVATAGEVLALDSGGFGPISITKAVSVVAPKGVEGSITQNAAGQNAITVNAPGATVVLRGLSVFGGGAGNDGVYAVAVSTLIVDSCNFTGFAFSGIEFTLTSAAAMSVYNCAFLQNAVNGVVTYGQTADLARFLIRYSRFENNGYGLNLFEGSRGTISESSVSHNSLSGFIVQTQATGQTANLDVDHCVISGNANGIYASSSAQAGVETVRVAQSVIVNNTTNGLLNADATAHIASRSDNTLKDNGTDGAFTDFFTTH